MTHPADLEAQHIIPASADTGPVNGDTNQVVPYCLGFAFGQITSVGLAPYGNLSGINVPGVALIQKNRPDWQLGKLNGIGGHVEVGERDVDAMVREFREESGALTDHNDWTWFATMDGDHWEVQCYFTHNVDLHALRTMTDEPIQIVSVDSVASGVAPIVDHVAWLIPLALDETARHFRIHA